MDLIDIVLARGGDSGGGGDAGGYDALIKITPDDDTGLWSGEAVAGTFADIQAKAEAGNFFDIRAYDYLSYDGITSLCVYGVSDLVYWIYDNAPKIEFKATLFDPESRTQTHLFVTWLADGSISVVED